MIRKLDTIQKKEKLNSVFATDEVGNGGANHVYVISKLTDDEINNFDDVEVLSQIEFQDGPRHEEGSFSGIIDSDLLEIVKDRLSAFQNGPFSSEYNEKALEHINQALYWMNKRIEDRIERNVLGKNEK